MRGSQLRLVAMAWLLSALLTGSQAHAVGPLRDDWRTPEPNAAFLRVLMLRVDQYWLQGADFRDSTTGVVGAGDVELWTPANTHHSFRFLFGYAIGGGTGGLQGELRGTLTAGPTLARIGTMTLFARGGLGWQVVASREFHTSYLQLPRVDFGLSGRGRSVLWELHSLTGPILLGTYDFGGRRPTGVAPFVGGGATLQADRVRFALSALRIYARGTLDGSPLDQLRDELCGIASPGLLICAHAGLYRGRVDSGEGGRQMVTAPFLGASIGFGASIPARYRQDLP